MRTLRKTITIEILAPPEWPRRLAQLLSEWRSVPVSLWVLAPRRRLVAQHLPLLNLQIDLAAPPGSSAARSEAERLASIEPSEAERGPSICVSLQDATGCLVYEIVAAQDVFVEHTRTAHETQTLVEFMDQHGGRTRLLLPTRNLPVEACLDAALSVALTTSSMR